MAPNPKKGTEGEIEANPNKGLVKPGQRGKLMWKAPTIAGEEPSEPIEVPEEEIFPIRLESSETFEQSGKKLPQWKTFTDSEGHLPATARAFIDPVDRGLMRIYAFDPPREIAQGEKDPADETQWRVRKIDPRFLPAVKGGTMKINPGRPIGRPYRDIDARLATIKEEREGLIEQWADFPEWMRQEFPGRYSDGYGGRKPYEPSMEGRVIGGRPSFGEQPSHFTKLAYGAGGLYAQKGARYGTVSRYDSLPIPSWSKEFLRSHGMDGGDAAATWEEMKTLYHRDEDLGQEYDSLTLTGKTGAPSGGLGEAWGRSFGKDWKGDQKAGSAKGVRAKMLREPLEKRAMEMTSLTEEEKEGKTEEEQKDLLVLKRARVTKELQRRGLIPTPGEVKDKKSVAFPPSKKQTRA
jgi:hypothetical protein